ncbi:SMI1/KNR4 family protein [Gracilibacillus caseinilyticus]|uniref:SMI1/KNR4 family protein n=1 Tax=Gracilibacillus caseinilyticus TaxID=2932256 RepID=A0ABY4F133_9BACI|nr:SMI1/KNR4 family protein [Gracilibacillus caseinilyticus]UOQ50392.1 SMI1/KNR4 family protein [Gracilibacillus caseinilyticus]
MTNNESISEAKQLIERIKLKYPEFVDKTASESDIARLERKLNIKLPKWYIELYTTVPLIGAEFGVQEDEPIGDYDGVSYMIWGSVDDIIEENTEYEPGTSALKDGYVFIASCSHGSGDPIFIKLNSDEPGVCRIYHDDFTKSQLAENVVSLFKNAKI